MIINLMSTSFGRASSLIATAIFTVGCVSNPIDDSRVVSKFKYVNALSAPFYVNIPEPGRFENVLWTTFTAQSILNRIPNSHKDSYFKETDASGKISFFNRFRAKADAQQYELVVLCSRYYSPIAFYDTDSPKVPESIKAQVFDPKDSTHVTLGNAMVGVAKQYSVRLANLGGSVHALNSIRDISLYAKHTQGRISARIIGVPSIVPIVPASLEEISDDCDKFLASVNNANALVPHIIGVERLPAYMN